MVEIMIKNFSGVSNPQSTMDNNELLQVNTNFINILLRILKQVLIC